jgi:hypothetical protein
MAMPFLFLKEVPVIVLAAFFVVPHHTAAVGSGNAQMTISTITPRCRPLFRNSCRALMMV